MISELRGLNINSAMTQLAFLEYGQIYTASNYISSLIYETDYYNRLILVQVRLILQARLIPPTSIVGLDTRDFFRQSNSFQGDAQLL